MPSHGPLIASRLDRALRHEALANSLLDKYEKLPRALEFLDYEAERVLTVRVQESWAKLSDVEIEAPPGKLGISFVLEPGTKKPIVDTLKPNSPLRGFVGLKWRVLTIDGVDVTKVEDEHEISKMLLAKADKPRWMKFDAGEPKKPTPKLLLIACLIMFALCLFVGSGQARAIGWFGDAGREQASLEVEMAKAASPIDELGRPRDAPDYKPPWVRD